MGDTGVNDTMSHWFCKMAVLCTKTYKRKLPVLVFVPGFFPSGLNLDLGELTMCVCWGVGWRGGWGFRGGDIRLSLAIHSKEK